MLSIIPYDHSHYARLDVRVEQRGELRRMEQLAGQAAELGPAFSAVETDDDGQVLKVLACAGLMENRPNDHPRGGYASAWAAFGEDLGARQMSAITYAIRGVIEGAGYAKIDMLVAEDFPAAQRYAEALGFKRETTIYARYGGAGEA